MKSFSQNDLLTVAKSPGAQYMLVNKEYALERMNAGYADLVAQRPVVDATTFNAYSITKTFTAAAILQLAEQGKLQLDEEANVLLPGFTFSGKFSIRQLLSHQAGIANPLPIRWIHLANDAEFVEKDFTRELISQHLKLRFAPGSKMSYSNIGYLLLGCILEKVAGVDYKTFVRENILKPSARNGYMDFPLLPAVHATGYHPKLSFSNLLLTFLLNRKKFMRAVNNHWSAFNNHYVNGSPYGGLIANADGVADYLRALLQEKLLNKTSLAQFFTIQKDNMCLSWYKGKLGEHDYVCHAGGGGGYYCELRLYPRLQKGSALLTNRSGFSDQRLLDNIDRHFIK